MICNWLGGGEVRDKEGELGKLDREMADKPEVLEAVLKETVDLVIDLTHFEAFCWFMVDLDVHGSMIVVLD